MLRTDIETDNGVIHVVEKVLYPPTVGNIVETLRSDPEKRFTTLLKALKFTGVIREISDYSSKSSKSQLTSCLIHSTNRNGTLEHKSRNKPNKMGQQLKIEDSKAQNYKTI